jgi:hypothetical protein
MDVLQPAARDEGISGDEVTQWLLGGLYDPDARCYRHFSHAIGVIDNLEV